MIQSVRSRFQNWIQARSLYYFTLGSGCCADEVLNTEGCRYDFERFGCVRVHSASEADLLIVNNVIHSGNREIVRKIYERMRPRKFVMAVGACAASGGPFCDREKQPSKDPGAVDQGHAILTDIRDVLPVDVYVPGCPPRPESIMHAMITLQERIHG